MNKKRILLISFIITIVYFVLSGLSFIYHLDFGNSFLKIIENILLFPATMIWRVGYGAGDQAAIFTGISVFLIIFIMVFSLIMFFSWINN